MKDTGEKKTPGRPPGKRGPSLYDAYAVHGARMQFLDWLIQIKPQVLSTLFDTSLLLFQQAGLSGADYGTLQDCWRLIAPGTDPRSWPRLFALKHNLERWAKRWSKTYDLGVDWVLETAFLTLAEVKTDQSVPPKIVFPKGWVHLHWDNLGVPAPAPFKFEAWQAFSETTSTYQDRALEAFKKHLEAYIGETEQRLIKAGYHRVTHHRRPEHFHWLALHAVNNSLEQISEIVSQDRSTVRDGVNGAAKLARLRHI